MRSEDYDDYLVFDEAGKCVGLADRPIRGPEARMVWPPFRHGYVYGEGAYVTVQAQCPCEACAEGRAKAGSWGEDW